VSVSVSVHLPSSRRAARRHREVRAGLPSGVLLVSSCGVAPLDDARCTTCACGLRNGVGHRAVLFYFILFYCASQLSARDQPERGDALWRSPTSDDGGDSGACLPGLCRSPCAAAPEPGARVGPPLIGSFALGKSRHILGTPGTTPPPPRQCYCLSEHVGVPSVTRKGANTVVE
jgi:hypothetical protein